MPPSIETGNIENERIPRSISPADSEYGSMLQSVSLPDIIFTSSHLKYLNQRLSALEPEDILRWCLISLPGLFQTTALGLTGISFNSNNANTDFQDW
jgi:phosphoadenosine phosphosulfate reductase